MHLEDFILGPFELNDPCMNVKFVTLHVLWTLGGQIYVLNALRPIMIDCIFLDIEGLGESFLGLGESGCIFHQILVFLDQLLRLKVSTVI